MFKYDAAYARQSLLKKDSISIAGQLDLCRKAAGDKELQIYKDAGYSGKNTERPDFQRLMRDIRADKIQTLYVYRLDRFSRSVADFGQLWDVLQAHHVEFVSVSENFDTSTPMGRAMLHIIMVFAQLERETTAARVKDNYYRRAALGSWPGGPAPYGFDNGRVCGSDGRQVPALIPNRQADVVLRIFQEYDSEDMSLSLLARRLTVEKIPAPKRATWDNVTLSRLLHNPAYVMADEQVRLHYLSLGVNITSPPDAFDGIHSLLLIGKRSASDRKYTNFRNHSASVLNSVGIVPAQLWLRCQDKLAANRQIGNSGRGKHTWLSGLLKCAKCGYSLKVITDRQHRYLVCSGRYNLSRCDAVIRASLTEVEGAVEQEISKLLEALPADLPQPQERDLCTIQLEELDRRTDRLMDAFAESSDLPAAYLKRALARLEQERQAILEKQQRQQKNPVLPELLHFGKLSFDAKKAVAAAFIRRIEVSERTAEVIWTV